MKSIRTCITLPYMLMFLLLWIISGSVAFVYVHMAITQHSSDALTFLLEKQTNTFNRAIDGITRNTWTLTRFIAQEESYDENFYAELKKRAILAFDDQRFIKTVYFCPSANDNSSVRCMYLMNIENATKDNFRFTNSKDGNFLDISFDTATDGSNRDHIPWFYLAKEIRKPQWVGPYQNVNVEDIAFMISYFSPIIQNGEFKGVVGIEVSTLSIRSGIDNLNYKDSFGILTNSQGDLIYHKDFPAGLPFEQFDMYEELKPFTDYFSDLESVGNKTFYYNRQTEKHRLLINRLKNDMVLAVSVPDYQITTIQYKMLLQLLILFILTILLSNLVLLFVSNRIVKPIEVINHAAHFISHGELNTKIPVYTNDELGMLASSIRKIEVELSEYIEHIRGMAYTDSMTGCHNKSAYLKHLSELEKKIDEGMAAFNVYLFDVNGLKRINDTLGHEMGDALIKAAASALKMTFNEKSIYRTGGDEFIVIIENERDDINENLKAFNEAVTEFNKENPFDFTLAVSCGTATFKAGLDTSFKTVAERADKAMYENKEDFYKNHEDLRRK